MATVEKKLKTLDVYLLYDGEKVTISDTADDNKATRALNEFKKYETMHYETEENGQKVTNAIPYHAVEHIEATESGGEPTGEVWYTGTVNECDGQPMALFAMTETDAAKTQELGSNPKNYSLSMNGIALTYSDDYDTWSATTDSGVIGVKVDVDEEVFAVAPCDWAGRLVEVTVTKKGGGGSDN